MKQMIKTTFAVTLAASTVLAPTLLYAQQTTPLVNSGTSSSGSASGTTTGQSGTSTSGGTTTDTQSQTQAPATQWHHHADPIPIRMPPALATTAIRTIPTAAMAIRARPAS